MQAQEQEHLKQDIHFSPQLFRKRIKHLIFHFTKCVVFTPLLTNISPGTFTRQFQLVNYIFTSDVIKMLMQLITFVSFSHTKVLAGTKSDARASSANKGAFHGPLGICYKNTLDYRCMLCLYVVLAQRMSIVLKGAS